MLLTEAVLMLFLLILSTVFGICHSVIILSMTVSKKRVKQISEGLHYIYNKTKYFMLRMSYTLSSES